MASSAGKRSRTRTKRFNEAEEEFSDDYLEEEEEQPKRKKQKTAAPAAADDEFKSTTPKKEGAKRGRKKKEVPATEENTAGVATSTDSVKPEESGAGEESKAGEAKQEEAKPAEQATTTTEATMTDATAPTTEATEAQPVTEPKEELHTETMRTDHDIPLTREMVVEPEKQEEKPEEKQEEEREVSPEEKEKETKEIESSILEKGIIYFFYRPKVGVETPTNIDDVQKLYLLLCPGLGPKESTEVSDRTKRLIVIGRKQLPDLHDHGRYWGFVDRVSTNVKTIVDENLKEEKYETPVTEQERTLAPARLAGRGVYGIIDHHSHSHLAYVLELPEEVGDVQKAFNIAREGSYIVSVKNPKQGAAYAGLSPERRAKYPDELQEVFEDRRWNRLNPVKLLDYEGCELFIMGAHEDLSSELGAAGKKIEELEDKDIKHLTDRKVFNHLALNKNKTPVEPLLSGEWA